MLGRISAAIVASMTVTSLATAQTDADSYNYRERVWQTAFNTGNFFESRPKRQLFMSIAYTGNDWGVPVYAIAVRKGCTNADKGEARKNCGKRMTARMIRSPKIGTTSRQSARGQALFGALSRKHITNDAALVAALDEYGLEWLEADINQCAPAAKHLKTVTELRFSPDAPYPEKNDSTIVLHADKITFDYSGDYLSQSSYYGWLKQGSPAEWANEFAKSLETCWNPSEARKPWLIEQASEPDSD